VSGTRVYLPSTLARLRDLLATREVGPSPLQGHAVTDALRTEYSDGGEEEWEYAALTAAAQDSVGLLDAADVPRRVVVVVDTDGVAPVQGAAPTLVELTGTVPLRRVAAVHVDDADAETQVAAAREVWHQAADGDQAAVAALDRCLHHELGWFATQELADLLRAGPATPGVGPD